MAEEAAVEARFLKTLMDFRRGLHDVIYGGRFIREMAAEGDNPLLHAPGFGDEAAVLASGVGNARRQARLHRREPRREGPKVSLPGVKPFRIEALSGKRIDL